ncbi:ProQ/FinO family protein [Pseudomonas aeruginosa]
MGFEQLAELRDRLKAQAQKAEKPQASSTKPKSKPGRTPKSKAPAAKANEKKGDPVVGAIWRLQKHFPLAFPISPAPKLPLKLGILEDAMHHSERLGVAPDHLKQAIATWCRGARYWNSLTEDAPRVDLNGQPAGVVTKEQAQSAKGRTSYRQNRRPQEQTNSEIGGEGQSAEQ